MILKDIWFVSKKRIEYKYSKILVFDKSFSKYVETEVAKKRSDINSKFVKL